MDKVRRRCGVGWLSPLGERVSNEDTDGESSTVTADDSAFGGEGNISGYAMLAMLDSGRSNSTRISLGK